MAMPRAYWTGYLRLSLVSIDVALYSATERTGRVSLRQIHEPSGKRIRYLKVPEGGTEEAESGDIVKAYEAKKGSYVVLEPEELDEIKLETKNTIRIDRFVELNEIDPRYFERPYYLKPRGKDAAEGFVVIREALRRKKVVALAQMVLSGREQLVALRPCGKGLLLEKLRYGDEVRASEAIFEDIPDMEIDEEMDEMAEALIEKKTGEFDPDDFDDSYEVALRELIERKAEEEEIVTESDSGKAKKTNVVDLMDALKKSLDETGAKSGASKSKSASKPKSKAKAQSKKKAS